MVYLIIAGDFGGLWSERLIEEKLIPYTHLPFTILFVDGNHENFDMLNQCQLVVHLGALMHQIDEHIFHVLHGEIMTIENKTFLYTDFVFCNFTAFVYSAVL